MNLKASTKPDEAKMIARAVPYIGKQSTGSDEEDAKMVSKAIADLVEMLGHKTSLTEVGY